MLFNKCCRYCWRDLHTVQRPASAMVQFTQIPMAGREKLVIVWPIVSASVYLDIENVGRMFCKIQTTQVPKPMDKAPRSGGTTHTRNTHSHNTHKTHTQHTQHTRSTHKHIHNTHAAHKSSGTHFQQWLHVLRCVAHAMQESAEVMKLNIDGPVILQNAQ